MVGEFYERGLGVETNLAEARRWYQRASELGSEAAGRDLARLETQVAGMP
jgi:TPR repeat protein